MTQPDYPADGPKFYSSDASSTDQNSLAAQQLKLMERLAAQQHQIQQLLAAQTNRSASSVKIVDFNMPFFALVGMLVKFAFASIPAAIILWIVFAVLGAIIVAVLSALGGLGALLMG
ncbi:MAG: hypothetical protein KDE04_03040 [Anaerolineales bacterium]|nr:hypothetical protein [Anaerolineales bacterium]